MEIEKSVLYSNYKVQLSGKKRQKVVKKVQLGTHLLEIPAKNNNARQWALAGVTMNGWEETPNIIPCTVSVSHYRRSPMA